MREINRGGQVFFVCARGAPKTDSPRAAFPRFEPYRPHVKDIAGLAGANSLKLLLLPLLLLLLLLEIQSSSGQSTDVGWQGVTY